MTDPTQIKEIEVELDNEPGTLAEVSEVLGNEGINILGFSCAAQGNKGTACFVTNDPNRTVSTLKDAGYKPRMTDAVFVPTPNEPGELAHLAERLGGSGVNIERSFVASDSEGSDLGIGFRVDNVQQAMKVLQG